MALIISDVRLEPEQPDVFDLTVAALHRATGPNLGSICLSSLIVAVMRFLGRVAVEARRVCPFATQFISAKFHAEV